MAGASGRLPPVGPSRGTPDLGISLKGRLGGAPGRGRAAAASGWSARSAGFFFLPCAFRDVFRPYAEAPARAPGGLQGVRVLGDRGYRGYVCWGVGAVGGTCAESRGLQWVGALGRRFCSGYAC
jgi:hypothetical protein